MSLLWEGLNHFLTYLNDVIYLFLTHYSLTI